jgi:hypothetical protein
MELQMRWLRLVEGCANLRRLIRQPLYTFALAGAKQAEAEVDVAWTECYERLECVLAALDEHALLRNRLMNARRYFQDGERWPAVWEITQALNRIKSLRRLYCRE